MASLWEKKIGEDKAQKRSPVAISKYASALSGKAASPAKTAREEPPEIVLKMGPLADADEVQSENTSEQDPLELRKQKTLDIAQSMYRKHWMFYKHDYFRIGFLTVTNSHVLS